MAIIKDPYAKKQRKDPYALNGNKIRPIPREEFSADRDARAVFAGGLAGALTKGPNSSQRRFSADSSGSKIKGALGGGTYEPSAAPHNPGNSGSV